MTHMHEEGASDTRGFTDHAWCAMHAHTPAPAVWHTLALLKFNKGRQSASKMCKGVVGH